MKTIEQIAKLKMLIASLEKQVKPTDADRKALAEKWYADKGITIIQRGLVMALPTKQGTKKFEAVKFSNGRIGVYTRGNSQIAYAWN